MSQQRVDVMKAAGVGAIVGAVAGDMSEDRRGKNIGFLLGAGGGLLVALAINNPDRVAQFQRALMMLTRYSNPEGFAEDVAREARRIEASEGLLGALAYIHSLNPTPEEWGRINARMWPPQMEKNITPIILTGRKGAGRPVKRKEGYTLAARPTGYRAARPAQLPPAQVEGAQLPPAQPEQIDAAPVPTEPARRRGGRTRSVLAVRVGELVGRNPAVLYAELLNKTFIVTYPANPERTKKRMAKHGKALRNVLTYHYPEKLPGGKRAK